MSTTVHVSMAAAGGDDIENAWAVHRAAEMCRYESWNQCASDINFEQLTRKEKLFFLRCWKFAVENGSFMRIFGGYNALFANVCEQNSDILQYNEEFQKAFDDAELLPVVLEAYEECRAVVPAIRILVSMLDKLCLATVPVSNIAFNLGQSHEQWPTSRIAIEHLDGVRREAVAILKAISTAGDSEKGDD